MKWLKDLLGLTRSPIELELERKELERSVILAEKWFLDFKRSLRPIILRVYYISVKNVEQNAMFYEKWVNSWLAGREETLDYILNEYGSLPSSIPEPEMLPALPKGWEVSCVLAERNLVVYNEVYYGLFNFQGEYLTFKGLNFILRNVLSVMQVLRGINQTQGFVRTIDIFSSDYPIVNSLAKKIFKSSKEWMNLSVSAKEKCYVWITQIIKLEIYNESTKCLSILKYQDPAENLEVLSLVSQFEVIRNWAYSMLDNSIKIHLTKKLPRISRNVFAGFDTEYIPLDIRENQLVSAQLSVTNQITITVPIEKPFSWEGISTLSSESYIKTPPKFEDLEGITGHIRNVIAEIRKIRFGYHDLKMIAICNNLITKHGQKLDNYCLNERGYLFQFKKSPIKNFFILPKEGERLKIRFDTLTNIINNCIDLTDYTHYLDLLPKEDEELIISRKETPSWNSESLEQSFKLLSYQYHLDNTFNIIKDFTETIVLSNEENSNKKPKAEMKNCNIYFMCHYNTADLSMLDDWSEISKRNIDIIKKSYCSIKTPIKSLGSNIYIRDTLLLSSAAAGSLEAIGKSHGLKKVEIPAKYYIKMDVLLKEDFNLFKRYAMQDSLITLIHGLFMNDFAIRLGLTKLPVTLGSLASAYLRNKWKADNYKGYQIHNEYLLGNAQQILTPKGVSIVGKVAENLGSFIGTFRGGRNECFSYGEDSGTKWYDYDLASCYSTVMSMLGDTDYSEGKYLPHPSPHLIPSESDDPIPNDRINDPIEGGILQGEARTLQNTLTSEASQGCIPEERGNFPPLIENLPVSPENDNDNFNDQTFMLSALSTPDYYKSKNINIKTDTSKLDFKKSYSALRVYFNLPDSIKFPPIPVTLDETITVYPLSGESLITGIEYLSAKNILMQHLSILAKGDKTLFFALKKKYFISISAGFYVPFKEGYKPFYNVINELQANRRTHKKLSGKGSAMERIYKDLGNMLYGKTVAGISNKRKFDSRSETMKIMKGGFLTNPLIGSWITGFVRALLAEMLNQVDLLGGKVTAVTTDGFVTDIENLEEKVAARLYPNSLLNDYRQIRETLSGDPAGLEIKTSVEGLIQWSTRGQISTDNNPIKIAALTGFQKHLFAHEEVVKKVSSAVGNGNNISFISKRLTGALDNYKEGALLCKEGPKVSMIDSLRNFKTIFDSRRVVCPEKEGMNFTVPFKKVHECSLNRTLIKDSATPIYSSALSHLQKTSLRSFKAIDNAILLFLISYIKYNDKPTTVELHVLHKLILSALAQSDSTRSKYKKFSAFINTLFQLKYFYNDSDNKIVVTRNNQDFVFALHELLLEQFSNTKLYEIFRENFSNFDLPKLDLVLHPSVVEVIELEQASILRKQQELKDKEFLINLISARLKAMTMTEILELYKKI